MRHWSLKFALVPAYILAAYCIANIVQVLKIILVNLYFKTYKMKKLLDYKFIVFNFFGALWGEGNQNLKVRFLIRWLNIFGYFY